MRDSESRIEAADKPGPHPARTRPSAQQCSAADGAAGHLAHSAALGPAGMLRLQRAVGNAGVSSMLANDDAPSVLDVVSSGAGAPLEVATRTDMEARFGGADFSGVRVHTDSSAHESAKSLHAQAYTVGSDIVFQRGTYNPGSASGQHVLAHELTHVMQQRSGPVDGSDIGGGVRMSDPGDRFEREAADTADTVMAMRPATAEHQTAQALHADTATSLDNHQGTGAPKPQLHLQREEEEGEAEA